MLMGDTGCKPIEASQTLSTTLPPAERPYFTDILINSRQKGAGEHAARCLVVCVATIADPQLIFGRCLEAGARLFNRLLCVSQADASKAVVYWHACGMAQLEISSETS